jgi:hypothetical protein
MAGWRFFKLIRIERYANDSNERRHRERSEAIQGNVARTAILDHSVAPLLAMTIKPPAPYSGGKQCG